MHGPTFMANPLACAAALASIELLLESPWQVQIASIEQGLREGLEPCRALPGVTDVRVLGAIGVVELATPVDLRTVSTQFVEAGVWVRPFGKLVYLMPPYIINRLELDVLTAAVTAIVTANPQKSLLG
jgi:adenosylmethionine-8-amino-7-oxononanoate aminotransferase